MLMVDSATQEPKANKFTGDIKMVSSDITIDSISPIFPNVYSS